MLWHNTTGGLLSVNFRYALLFMSLTIILMSVSFISATKISSAQRGHISLSSAIPSFLRLDSCHRARLIDVTGVRKAAADFEEDSGGLARLLQSVASPH